MFNDFWGLEYIWPALVELAYQFKLGNLVLNSIIDSVAFFPIKNKTIYFENYLNLNLEFSKELIYLDNYYWDKFRIHHKFVNNNNFVWDYNDALPKYNLNSYPFWLNLYPYNLCENTDIFNLNKMHLNICFYKLSNEIYDIPLMNSELLRHHDYHNNIRICSSLFWLNENSYNNLKGFNLYWYEPFGAVEIGIKSVFTYWYDLMYPDLEEYLCLYKTSIMQDTTGIYSDLINNYRIWSLVEFVKIKE